jgi:hypothetical protein
MFNAQDYVEGQLMTHAERGERIDKQNLECFIEPQGALMQRPDIDQEQERKHSVKQSHVPYNGTVYQALAEAIMQRTEKAEKDDEHVAKIARTGHYIATDHGVRNISSAQDFTITGSDIDLETGKSFEWRAATARTTPSTLYAASPRDGPRVFERRTPW